MENEAERQRRLESETELVELALEVGVEEGVKLEAEAEALLSTLLYADTFLWHAEKIDQSTRDGSSAVLFTSEDTIDRVLGVPGQLLDRERPFRFLTTTRGRPVLLVCFNIANTRGC